MKLPLFITGYERSGTTLLRRIVSMHPDLPYEIIHENRKLLLAAESPSHALKTMKYAATQAKQKTGSTMSIEAGQKLPYTTLKQAKQQIKKMRSLFPDTRIIHIVRDPMGAINSQVRTFNKDPRKCIDDYFASVTLASDWIEANFEHLTIDYNSLIQNARSETRRIYDWIGGNVSDNHVDQVLNTRDPWNYNGRIMCGLRYFNNIKQKPTHNILSQEVQDIISKLNFIG